MLNDEQPWIYLWWPLRYWAASNRIQNIKGNLGTPGYHPAMYQAEETWTLPTWMAGPFLPP